MSQNTKDTKASAANSNQTRGRFSGIDVKVSDGNLLEKCLAGLSRNAGGTNAEMEGGLSEDRPSSLTA